jgi:hypothetical protein
MICIYYSTLSHVQVFSLSKSRERRVQSKKDDRTEMFGRVIALLEQPFEGLSLKEGDEVEQKLGCVWWYNGKALK